MPEPEAFWQLGEEPADQKDDYPKIKKCFKGHLAVIKAEVQFSKAFKPRIGSLYDVALFKKPSVVAWILLNSIVPSAFPLRRPSLGDIGLDVSTLQKIAEGSAVVTLIL